MIKIVEGDILQAEETIICHQVNCQGVMGAGLADKIRRRYPEVYPAYVKYVEGCKDGNRINLLGNVQTVPVDNDTKIIANLFGQFYYGRQGLYTSYSSLREALEDILKLAKMFNDSIAIPHGIGCGLAGGDWSIVYSMIEDVFKDYDVTIYKLNK